MTVRIHLNGRERAVSDGTSVDDLVRELAPPPDTVAVEINRVIVPKSTYAERRLEDGDEVEIVTIVGGG